MAEISKQEQLDVAIYIKDTFDNYKELNQERRWVLYEIYQEYRSFTQEKVADWSSTFKVNKAHEIVNKLLPRIIAKNPRWLVNLRTDEFRNEDKLLSNEELLKRRKQLQEATVVVQDYLTYIFDRYNLKEPVRLWAKNMLIYGNSYAKVKYKYETARIRNDEWVIEENVIWEYPTIDAKSWTDIYIDPRYILLEDAPALIEVINNVRLADLKRKKDKYINIDKIDDLPNTSEFQEDEDGSKARMYEVTWIPTTEFTNWVDKNSLTIKTFYGKYALEWEEEKLYRVSTVNDMIIIEFEEITCIPYEDIKAFDDTETSNAVWVVEPIMSLQRELNFKKNSASEYINHSLNRSYIWSPNSWVNPADLISRPNNIIATTKDAVTAQNNLIEQAHRPLDSSYFAEQNDIERQIQAQTFTVDTSANRSNQALTNTATGARIKFFESNTVIDELRQHFEEGLERLAYKLLETTFENMEDNIVIKKLGDEWFWEINKELLRDAFSRYSIKIEANSSSLDDIERRREDSIGFFNTLALWAQAGVPVDFTEGLKDVINTFEKRDPDRFIKSVEQQQAEQIPELEWQEPVQNPAAALTEEVAKWAITTWI